MTFSEMCLAVEKESNQFDKFLSNCLAFSEASEREFEINCKEAELKVISENLEFEDYLTLEAAAAEDKKERNENIISKMITGFINWIKSICASVSNFFNKEDTNKTIKKAQEICKNNPNVANKTVEIPNIDDADRVLAQQEAEINAILARRKAGKFTPEDDARLAQLEKELSSPGSALLKAGTITVGLAAAIALMLGIKKGFDKAQAEHDHNYNVEDTPYDMKGKIANTLGILFKVKKERKMNKFKGLQKIKEVISKIFPGQGTVDIKPDDKKVTKKDKKEAAKIRNQQNDEDADQLVNSSTEDIDYSSSTISESEYLMNLLKEVEESVEEESDTLRVNDEFDTEESTIEGNNDEPYGLTAEEYLESLESELFGNSDNVLEEKLNDIVKELGL